MILTVTGKSGNITCYRGYRRQQVAAPLTQKHHYSKMQHNSNDSKDN